jgi:hypothetical protein
MEKPEAVSLKSEKSPGINPETQKRLSVKTGAFANFPR